MNSLPAKILYNKISHSLLSTKWLDDIGLNHSLVKSHIKSTDFTNGVSSMAESRDFSCRKVLSLILSLLDVISQDKMPENWLLYIYQYTLSKSFPDSVDIELLNELKSPCELYLRLLRVVSQFQMDSKDNTWQSKYPLKFITPEEEESLEYPGEYRRFLQAFSDDCMYELMKLNQEILGFNTLDHICGVHYLALSLGRQIVKLGLPVDLGRISGAAAGHDIGKFGCRKRESQRVPYLHYYYSDVWFKRYDINYIRHIALNHSTWDLELENLPIESLLLIYSDFRVKSVKGQMKILTLADSFDIILNKLDNVDEKKERRYRRVYAKLKDFENFMEHLSINTDLDSENIVIEDKRTSPYSLMQGPEIIENLKFLSINHNINLMYQLRDEFSLDRILQMARSEKDWKSLREYIRIFEEYSTYLTQKQKLQTIRFLYEQLTHPEDDIRRHCAELIGTLIAIYDEDYRKEIPDDVSINSEGPSSVYLLDEYLHDFLYPGHKIIQNHRSWIGYSTSIMVSSLFSHCRSKLCGEYKKVLLKFFNENIHKNRDVQLYLIKVSECIPASDSGEKLDEMFQFLLNMLKKQSSALRLSALEALCTILPYLKEDSVYMGSIREYFNNKLTRSKLPAENYLRLRTAKELCLGSEIISMLEHYCKLDSKRVPDIFLGNLKTATDWVTKKINVDILLEYTLQNPEVNGLHTAMHFCNLLKVSAIENVRDHAGEAILEIAPRLPLEQRNEIAVEMVRALEIEGHHFTEYIPRYLGQLILYLQPIELDEVIDDLIEKIKQSNPQIKSLLLKTIGTSISSYPAYKDRFSEEDNIYLSRLTKMLGILLNSLGDYNSHVKQVAFSVIGKDIFGSRSLSLLQKNYFFKLTAKKILTLIISPKNEELEFLTNSASLNHIYRFISDYTFFKGPIEIECPEKIAFFPGTFDPFTLSHKEIVRAIRDMGFEVYLAVDEFSWSKRTLPNLLRKKIINMSISDELNVYIYPEDYPTNLANPEDLRVLKDNFPTSEVYIVAGSDVLANASCYSAAKSENSVHTFNHIVIERETHIPSDKLRKYENQLQKIEGSIIKFTLPRQYSNISSTQIRNYIDENRDITSLVDPLVQSYVYEHGFYQREPQDKSMLQTSIYTNISIEEEFTPQLIYELACFMGDMQNETAQKLMMLSRKPSARLVVIRDESQGNSIMGFAALHWVRLSGLYEEFNDTTVSEYIRENTIGRIAVIDGIFSENNLKNKSLEQILLTEALSFCLSKDYQFAVYSSMMNNYYSSSLNEILTLQGFLELPQRENHPIFLVDMTNPCVLNLDLETIIKEPFRGSSRIRQAISQSRKRLQSALTKLYPGQLVLSFDVSIQHESMIKKICRENGIPSTITVPRKLGPYMCVPYGTILDRYIVPNTVTKALHTEKLFNPDMKGFNIGPFPHYLNLDIQVKTIRSFNRPIILVDDLLNKGYRIRALDPLFKKENVKVQKIIVGILSGRGKELMDRQNREIDSVYFLPRLHAWFNENSMYPFMGGDALWRGVYPERNLLPSINFILPYTVPTFIADASRDSVYNLSITSIENSISILSALESEYHVLNERNLTLSNLGEVFLTPRCPDHGRDVDYDLNLNPSHFLLNDLEQLRRLESIIGGA
jgi:Nicotinic acid mononucleotide adenylyltransferase